MVRNSIKVYLQKMQIVDFRLDMVFLGRNFHYEISKPTDQYGVYDELTGNLIKLCDSYNMALNFCLENDFEVVV